MPARPTFIEPCQPKAAKALPTGPSWLFEGKWDGYRCIVVKDGRNVRLFSRNRSEWTDRLPGIAGAFASLPCTSAVIDADLCAVDTAGKANFHILRATMRNRWPDETQLVSTPSTCSTSTARTENESAHRTQEEARGACREETGRGALLFLVEHFNEGDVLLKLCKTYGLEGVVAKRRDRPYTSGPCRG